jgi:hypothetical protein
MWKERPWILNEHVSHAGKKYLTCSRCLPPLLLVPPGAALWCWTSLVLLLLHFTAIAATLTEG